MKASVHLTKEPGKISDDEINAIYDEGNFFLCSGKYEEAIKCYDLILGSNPYSKTALGYKGLALLKLNRREDATRCYQKALGQ
ncbi:MAG: tetratricopeptide repeat protein [Nitrosotalea sp.]